MIPGMSGRLGKGTASTCGCELGCDALTMIPPDDAESPNALDDDDDDDPVDPVDPSPSTLDTNAFLVRLVLVPNASASPLPAPSASNSALGADVVRALAPRTARATCAPLHRAACRSSLRAIARVAYMFTTNATNAMTNAMRCDALGRDVSRAARDSRSARRDRGPIDSRRARSSRARVDARHRVTTRPRRSTSSVGDARRRGRSHSRARHRPTDATRARGGVMTTPARARRERASTPRLDVLRVSQVDAGRLDGELANVLNAQLERVMEATSACGRATTTTTTTTTTRASKANEMRLLLDCAMFACTTGVNRPTPGMELMNLRLRDERGDHGAATTTMKTGVEGPGLSMAQRIAYGLATCVVGYGWGLWQRKMLRERYDEDDEDDEGGGGWKYRAWKLSQTVENCYTMANFVNFCVFLRNGRYPTLLERALRARLVYQRPTMARVVDFEYLNQQLAWRELSELVLFTLPYLYSTRVRSTLGALTSRVGRGEASPPTNVADAPQRNRVAVQAYRCVACGCREPIHPFVAEPCGHPYCYYCLRARLVEQPTSCACVKCGKRVAEMRRLATTTS